MTEIEALKKRVAELEAEVARLKAAPPQQHWHYHYEQPAYTPSYAPQPTWPQYPQIWCSARGASA